MTGPAMPPVFQAVAQSYRDAVDCFTALRSLSLIALLILLAFQVIDHVLTIGPKGSTESLLSGFVIGLVQSYFFVPYLIAVHRWVILGETTATYGFAPSTMRFQHYFWWSAALNTVIVFPLFLVQGASPTPTAPPGTGVLLIAMLIFVVALILGLRLTLIFPAAAVDAPGANWDAAMADTKGYAWRIFMLGFFVGLPIIIAGIVVGSALETAPFGLRVPLVMVATGLNFALSTLFVIVASRLYLWIGDRVKRT